MRLADLIDLLEAYGAVLVDQYFVDIPAIISKARSALSAYLYRYL